MKQIFTHALRGCAVLLCAASIIPLATAMAEAKVKQSPAEQEAYQRKLFATIDENKDGKVTEKEFVVAVLYDAFASRADKKGRIYKIAYLAAVSDEKDVDGPREYALMDTEKKGYIIFKDVFRNTIALKQMRAEFRKLDKKGKGFITLTDLPDITP